MNLSYARATASRVWCAVALVTTLGCREIVGFDDPSPEAGGLALSKLPFTPASDDAQKCEACARERCSAEREACEDDAVCRTLLRCHAKCSNPACRARCGSFVFRDDTSYSNPLYFTGEESPVFGDYVACVGSLECKSECNTGRNWECVGDSAYRWPRDFERLEGDAARVRLEVQNFETYNGVPARVRATVGSAASDIVDQQQSDLWGQAEFAFDAGWVFRGYFEVESAERGGYRTLVQGPPIFRPMRWTTFAVAATTTYAPSAPGRASILLSITDCLGFPAPSVSFELGRATGEGFYYLSDAPLSLDASRTDGNGMGGFREVEVEAENYTIIAKHSGVEVARRNVVVRADWITFVSLDPREAE